MSETVQTHEPLPVAPVATPEPPKPVEAMSAREVKDAPNPYPPYPGATEAQRERYHALQARKDELDDEVAAARVAARLGRPPEKHWRSTVVASEEMRRLERAIAAEPDDDDARAALERLRLRRANGGDTLEQDDPRLEAWRGVHWKAAATAFDEIRGIWSLPEKPPPFDELCRIEDVLGRAAKALAEIRAQEETQRGM